MGRYGVGRRNGSGPSTDSAAGRSVDFDTAVLANLAEGVITVDRDGLTKTANAAAEALLGSTLSELEGKPLHDVLHTGQRHGTSCTTANCPVLEALATSQNIKDVEDSFVRLDGTFFDVAFNSSPFFDDGEAAGTIIVFRDVSERKLIEARLRESEERFAKFMQNLPGLAWIKDKDGRYVFANEEAEKAFGKRRHDLYGKTDFEVFPPEVAGSFVKNDGEARDKGRVQTIEALKDNSGSLRLSIVNKFQIPLDADAPMVGGIAIDITEQRRAEEFREFLFSISETIRVSRGADDLLADIAESLGKHLDVHRCLFNEIDLDHDTEIVHRDYSRTGESIAGQHKVSDYSASASVAMAAGQTIVNRDSRTDPRTAELFEKTYGPSRELAYITVPMLRDGNWVASLWCSDDGPRNWTEQEIELVENIAERTWSAVGRLRTEELLNRNQQMFSTLVEAAPFGVYFIDSDFRLVSVNSGAQAVFGGIEPLIGRDFAEVLRIVWPESFATEAIAKFRHTLATGEPYLAPTVTEFRLNREDTETYDWQIHRIVLPNGAYGVVCYFYDLTLQKTYEDAARRSSAIDAFRVELSDALRTLSDPEEIQYTAAGVLGKFLGADRAGYAEDQGDGRTVLIRRNYTHGMPGLEGRYSYEDYGAGLLSELQAGRTVLRPDIANDPLLSDNEKAAHTLLQLGATANAPLIKEGRLNAFLFVHFRNAHHWTEGEAALIEETAERTWAAVELARAEERERAQIKQTLAAQAKFESVFNQSGIFAGIVDLEGRVREVNELSVTACGYRKEDVLGLAFWETPWWRLSKDVKDRIRTATLAAAAGDVFRERLTYWWADGTERTVDFAMHPIRDLSGVVMFLHPTGIDITEQERAVETVRESEAKFRTVFESIDEGFVIAEMIFDDDEMPVDFRFLEANPAFTKLTGFPENAVGRTARDLVPDLEDFWFQTYGDVALTGRSARFEHYSEPMGRWFRVHASRIGGRPDRRVAIVFENITERKNIELQVEQISRMPEENPNPVMRISDKGEILYSNAAAQPLLDFWRRESGVDIQPGLRKRILEASRSGAKSVIEIMFGRRALSCVVAPIKGAGYVNFYAADVTDRKAAEMALRNSEERYRALTELSPQFVFMSRPDGHVTYVNQYTLDFTGKASAEMLGDGWADCIHPDHRQKQFLKWKSALENAAQFESDIPLLFRDGSYRTVYTRATAVRNDDGEVIYWIGTALDVEDRIQTERRLRESEERFSKAFKASPLVLTISSLVDGKLIEVNETFTAATGYSREEAIGKTTIELGLWAKPPDREAELEMLHTLGHLNNAEYVFRTRDGREIIGLLSAEKVEIGGGPCALSVIQDITERKRAEDALRESERRFRYTSDAAPVLIWMADAAGNCTWFNKGWHDFTGRTIEQESGQGWVAGVHADDRERCLSNYSNAFKAREEFLMEYRLKRADGEYRWVLDKGIPRYSPGGEFLGYIGSCLDIHDRRAAEAALRESRERLQLAQQAGNVGVWDWDVVAGKTYWSETMWKFYGEQSGSGNPDHDFWISHLHDDDRDRVTRRLNEVLASGEESYKDEFRIRGENGEIKWIGTGATVLRDPDGNAARVYGVNIDITERKLSEERIRRSENQLRLVTDSMPALIAYIDDHTRYSFVNEKYAEWFKLPVEQILGKKVRDIVGVSAFSILKPKLDAALAGKAASFQTGIRYKGAGSKFVSISYIPDVAEDGTVRGIYSLVSDLTDWKLSQELLISSEQRVAMLMETVTDYAIFSLNTDGIIETWTVGAENIFGYAADDVIGLPVATLYSEKDVNQEIPRTEMLGARRNSRAPDERWMVRKDGSPFFASGTMMPLRVGKRHVGYVKIVSDLTEKKRRAELLQEAHDELELRVSDRTKALADVNEALRREIVERERSEAVKIGLLHRIVSAQETERQRIARDIHDQLGQRLTALRLKLAALRDHCAEDSGLGPRVERLQEIAHLLDSEVSFLASELRPNTLDDLGLEEALRAHAGDWSRHYDVKLEFHSNGLSGKRLGRDTEIQLYRIAQEALNNVAKHAKASQVNLLLEKTGDTLMLIVEDNGAGFDAAAKAERRRSGGLGLVGMRERASLIGAAVEVESLPGKGTTIFVRLPLDRRRKEKE